MAQRKNVNDRIRWSHGTEQVSNESIADSLTPEVQFVGGVYRSSDPTYSNNQNVVASFTSDGKLRTDASISGDVNVDSTSVSVDGYVGKASGTNADFTTAYAGATTITLSSFPSDVTAFTADDIISVVQIATDGSVTETYTRDDSIMTMSGSVLTVGSAAFVNTDTFVVYTNVPRPSGGGGASVDAQYKSPSDFTSTYTSNTTITLSSLPFTITDSSQLVYVKVIPTSGNAAIYVNGSNSVTLTISSNVLTISGAGTPFASGDVYEIGINEQDKAYDSSTASNMVSVLNPVYSHTTDVETLVSATPYELTASFADVGAEIAVDTYNYITLWFTVDIGTSTNPQIRVLHKHTSAGSEEYREIYLGNPASNVTTINLNDYEISSDADQLFKITLPVTGSKYIQIQAKDDANGDGQIDALYVTKSW